MASTGRVLVDGALLEEVGDGDGEPESEPDPPMRPAQPAAAADSVRTAPKRTAWRLSVPRGPHAEYLSNV